MVRLTAIVPATNSPATLARCLEAIAASTRPPDEIVVVREPAFAGPAEARNSGAAQATGDVLVFVDADMLVHADAFERLQALFSSDEAPDAVFGSYDDCVATTRLAAAFRNLLHHHVHTRSPGPADTFWAGLGAVRSDVFAAAGGFDARRFDRPSIEDVELGMRLSDAGASIELDPTILATHLKDWTVTQMLRTDLFDRGVPWIMLLAERRRAPTSLNLGVRERLSVLASAAAVVSLLCRRPRTAAAAAGALVALNLPLYRLLLRRLGARRALACVPLHAGHHLAAGLAVPLGLIRYGCGRARSSV
jgi:GT2 family glycosyltransferase